MFDSFFKQRQRFFSRSGLTRVSLLAGMLAFGIAHAAADVNTEYINGELTGPQVFAGEGYRSIALVNSSDQPVDFTLSRLHDDVTVGTYVQANDALQQAISGADNAEMVAAEKQYIADVDGLSGAIVKAHGETDMYADLETGTYVVAAAPETEGGSTGAPAYLSFIVTESGAKAAAPEVTNSVDLADFSFDFPVEVKAGANLWKISNTGTQPHMAAFFKLLPGKTVADLKAFLSDQTGKAGAPPFDVNDTPEAEVLTPGRTAYLPLDFSQGDWVAVCFVQDIDNPAVAHFMEGMIEEFTVS